MKTVIYEPKYLEYPGVSLPTPEYGNSSGLADLFNLPVQLIYLIYPK